MPDVLDIVEIISFELEKNNELKDKNILITAGGTKEKIDPVRYISNNSSGKMGYSLAQAAIDLGAEVTLISNFGVYKKRFESTNKFERSNLL